MLLIIWTIQINSESKQNNEIKTRKTQKLILTFELSSNNFFSL